MNDFFNRLRWKIQNFMRGRYGVDELNKTLIYGALIVYLLSIFIHFRILYIAYLVLFAYAVYRMLSKNLYARREENRKFVTFMETNRIKYEQRKDYKIFKCKGCGRNIRVPRGKGKIEVTCPMCGRKTIHRT